MSAATIENVGCKDVLSEKAQKNLSDYLSAFLAPVIGKDAVHCPSCGGRVWSGGGVMDALLPGFQWGLVHGDGHCIRCKWPIRLYHFVELDGQEKQRFVYPLAYRCYEDEAHTIEIDPANRPIKRSDCECLGEALREE